MTMYFNTEHFIGGVDYGTEPTTYIPVVFSAGMTSVSFDIQIIDDKILENAETFTVSIDPVSVPYGVTLVTPDSATVSILDNDSKNYYNKINSIYLEAFLILLYIE